MFRRLFFFSLSLLVFAFSSPWVKQMHHFSVKKKKPTLFSHLSLPLCHFRAWKCSLPLIFFPQPGPYPTRAASLLVSSPCAFLLLTVFYSCGNVMYNCQTGNGERGATGRKTDTCTQKFRLLISFWCRWGKKRNVQSCGEPFWSLLQSGQLVMLLVVRHKDCVFICALHCFVVHCVMAQPLIPRGQKAY